MSVTDPRRSRTRRIAAHVFLTIVGATMIVPLLWMMSTSLKPGSVFHREEVWWQNWIPGERHAWADIDGQRVDVRRISRAGDSVKVRAVAGSESHDLPASEERTVAASAFHDEWQAQARWANYADAWSMIHMARGYANSVVVAILVTLGQVLTSSLAAFAFARLQFRGRDALFFGYLATMMIPSAVTMIPVYVLFAEAPEALNALFGTTAFSADYYLFGSVEVGRAIGINSFFALIVPSMFTAYGTFMLRQFFMSIPKELEEAARLDGCSTFGVYRLVVLPISKPALATLTLITFMNAWKSFTWPLIIGQSTTMSTLPVMLSQFLGEHGQDFNLLMAGSLIVLLPEIVVFVVLQRYFVEGIRLGALKG